MEINNGLGGINKNFDKLQAILDALMSGLRLIEVSRIQCQPKCHGVELWRTYWRFGGYRTYYRRPQTTLKQHSQKGSDRTVLISFEGLGF